VTGMVWGAADRPPRLGPQGRGRTPAPVRTSIQLLGASALLALATCSARPPAMAPPPAATAAVFTAPAVAPVPPPVESPRPAPAPPPTAAPEPAPIAVTFHRELEVSVTALAVERAPFVAAVTRNAVWMH
jgi:hypothetical protein